MPDKKPAQKKKGESLYNRDIVRKLTSYNKSPKDTYEEQIDFIDSYVNSPMYKKRLTNLLSKDIDSSGNFKNPLALKVGAKKGEDIKNVAKRIIDFQNKNLSKTNFKIGDTGSNLIYGQNVVSMDKGGEQKSNIVTVRPEQVSEKQGVVAHETSHASLGGINPYSSLFQNKYLSDKVKNPYTDFDYADQYKDFYKYQSSPSELKARIDSIRYTLKDLGIYDANKEEFNDSHYKKLIEASPNMQNSDLNDIKSISGEGLSDDEKKNNFIWLMNNIAKNGSTPQTGSGSLA